jgi:hypothetical protein
MMMSLVLLIFSDYAGEKVNLSFTFDEQLVLASGDAPL